jgi:hypothetical protein
MQTGDSMLYGSSTLVLFYKSCPTTYSYTKIGQVDAPAGLEVALGFPKRRRHLRSQAIETVGPGRGIHFDGCDVADRYQRPMDGGA